MCPVLFPIYSTNVLGSQEVYMAEYLEEEKRREIYLGLSTALPWLSKLV